MGEKKGLVLCVDDEPGILRSLQWLLQKDFDVFTAPGGQQALELLSQHDFDVVISDQRMPGMSGAEFLGEVRRISPRALRILLTGYSDLQAILRSVNEGEIFRFINKPWNIAELPRIVAEAALIARTQPISNPDTAPSTASETDREQKSILLVDDDPATARLLEEAVGDAASIIVARNLADAIAQLNSASIAVVVADTRVGNTDTTRLLKLLKQKHPQLVSVAVSQESDASELIALINQGQIHRFVPKPLQSGHLRIAVESALAKHTELQSNPGNLLRHAVEDLPPPLMATLRTDIEESAKQSESSRTDGSGDSLLQQVSGSLRRLFRS